MHVAEQRKTNGKRGVRADVVDATAMFDLLVARDVAARCVYKVVGRSSCWPLERIAAAGSRWAGDVTPHLSACLTAPFPA